MSISKGFLVGALLAGSCAWGAEDIKILDLLSDDEGRSQSTLSQMEENWQEGYAAIFIETFRLTNSPLMRSALGQALDKKLGIKNDKGRLETWWQEVWKKPENKAPGYAGFKAEIYKQIDPRFREYFDKNPQATIRMDEIRWGGVVRDGIPPLKDPKVLPAKAASYLGDSDVVFGVSFNGKARAYPKRILAWHEMVKDTVGGQTINGVYCTLCGSMIVYDPKYDGRHYELGTSGFLYRSNKLMYDHGTKSMWSTLKGEPVLGPLVGRGIRLKPLTVVTTTWGEWRQRHPETSVLSLDTGHSRDYGEGVAYESYFNNDRLMFGVPDGYKDKRLKNKDEVLILRFGTKAKDQVAIATQLLHKHPVYHLEKDGTKLVVLTDKSGASRAYESSQVKFKSWDQGRVAVSEDGQKWNVSEDELNNGEGQRLLRFASHNAFWFGWRAVFHETNLLK